MTPLPVVPFVIKCQFEGKLGDDTNVTTRFFLRYTGPSPTNAQATTFAQSLYTTWDAHLKAMHNPQFTFLQAVATDLSSTSGGTGIWAHSDAGVRAGTGLTAGACAMINLLINRRYRGGKPRMYFPAGSETDLATPQTWLTEFITGMNTAWTNVQTDLFGTAWTGATIAAQCNVSYYEGYLTPTILPSGAAKNHLQKRTTPLVDDIASFNTHLRVTSQRRRNTS